jgi:hypothetical protein
MRALADDGCLWLSEVPNRGPRRIPLYEKYPGIRGTGMYLIRDIQGPPNVFCVGKVVQDPRDAATTNPNADGIIGRLSGHQNMSGSNVLARWYQHAHPEVQVPMKVLAGELRDLIRGRGCAAHASHLLRLLAGDGNLRRGIHHQVPPP